MFQKTALFTSIFTLSLLAQDTESYRSQLEQFNDYKTQQEKNFQTYKEAQVKAFDNYKQELLAFWDDPKLSNKKEWVNYSKDKKTRTDVNFEQNKIRIETISDSENEAQEKIKIALAKAVTFDTKEAYEADQLEQKLVTIDNSFGVKTAQIDQKPILAPAVFEQKPDQNSVVNYVDTNTQDLKQTLSQNKKTIYYVDIELPKNSTFKRSGIYYQDVIENATKQEIPKALVFAVMHSESSFNPLARSHVPAYGLMQIVPKTAGIDAYLYVYNEKKLLSGSYLYNAKNNIELGTAYLHILYYKYLKEIKDPTSRLYCTIAAYNTGAGNIAYAFTRTYNIKNSVAVINQLSAEEVYNRLLKDLRYEEPKHYLKNVSQRMETYEKIYPQS